MAFEALTIARVLVLAFFAACFIQSGVDKIVDWKGNLSWITGHFGETFMKGMVPLLLGLITILECLTGITCAFAIVVLVTGGGLEIPTAAVGLAGLTLVMLFTGQRIAKDYVGAATLATYFVVAVAGLLAMGYSPAP